MDDRVKFSYFYGKEADQFSFYKIPKLLFTDTYFKSISLEAKVLYGLMLDRMSLSVKNQWMDDEGRAYIYFSVDDVMESLNCKNNKAIATIKELDTDSGIGLIEKKRQGQGKPTIIYVKQFLIQDAQKWENHTSGQNGTVLEMGKIHIKKCDSEMSGSGKIAFLEVGKTHTNKNNINNTDFSNTKSNHILSENDEMRKEMEAYSEIISENIELELLKERYAYEHELLDGIYELILETVLCKSPKILIASNEYSTELVKSKFLKLNSSHIEYVMDSMKGNTTKVHNIKKYMLAALFNAPTTISGYYQAEVNHDMPQFAVR